jgi:hypothetical protein
MSDIINAAILCLGAGASIYAVYIYLACFLHNRRMDRNKHLE